ncbi:hypothetical protein AKUH3B102A_PHAGE100080 (plasmid) [Apilactobacillus kunkeei]|nr:hypothetical protein AKUH3B102A_PHAGE100080 [Apilactobacillus kunkeei]CAI2700053.1 hypothetical protein AKUH3B107A_PHAGE100080 [Apilactobacillus kunkeei]
MELVETRNNQPVTTSLQVANTFGKRHDNVTRDITSLKKDVLNFEEMFMEGNIPDSYGRDRRGYYINKDGFTLLAMGFTGKKAMQFKLDYIQAFNQMEKVVQENNLDSYMIADPVKRAEKWIKEQEQTKLLAQQNEEMKPKALFADAVSSSKETILVGDLAKLAKQNGIQIGALRLFTWLRDHGYLIRRKGSDYNMPTQRSMEMGLFDIKETAITHSDGRTTLSKTPKVTGKDQKYFILKLLDEQAEGAK